MNKDDVELRLHSLMSERHWQFKRLCKLCAAFVRDLPVTPYFRPRVLRRWPGVYQIDGYVGVIHQTFEAQRPKPATRAPSGHFPCLSLNIANLKPLLGAQYIHENSSEKDLLDFTKIIGELMEAMPQDEASLETCFRENVLLAVPFENYAATERKEEFDALREFVCRETTT